MAQIPQLQSTNTLGTDDQAILRQGTIDKRISLELAGTLAWAKRNGYTHVGSHVQGLSFTSTEDFSTSQGKVYFVNSAVSLPYTSTTTDPSVDTNLKLYQEKDSTTGNIRTFPAVFSDGSYNNTLLEDLEVGDLVGTEDYAVGNNSGMLFFKVVAAGTGVHDGGKYIDLPLLGLQLEQNLPKVLNAKCFGLKGNFTDDDLPQLVRLWDYAPWGSTILYPEGQYKFDGGHTHPLKQLYHIGTGRAPTFPAGTTNIRGTSFYFPTFSGVNKGGFYMPPPIAGAFCRFSSFSDISFLGNGTDDNNGNVTCLKINNLGTHLNRVDFRYGAVGIENNYSVGANWTDVKALGSVYGVYHVYDAATPFGAEKNSVSTENTYTNIQVASSKTNVNAIGWYQDATCAYANNHHGGSFDCEQCYTGAKFEGRIATKDHDGIQVFGSASFQSAGNVFDSVWFEANVDKNLILSNDPGQPEPALTFRNLFEDVTKITTAGDTQNVLTYPFGDRPLKLGSTKDAPQGRSGTWSTPFTVGQYLLHGKEVNAPLVRSIVNESVSKKLGNRTSVNEKGGYSWTYAKDNVPLVGSTVNIANLNMYSSPYKSALIEFSIEAVSVSGIRYTHVGTMIVDNDNDSISSSLLQGMSFFRPGGAPSITLRGIRVATNEFGLFLFKAAGVTEVINATISLRYTVGAGSDGNRQSTLTTFGV